MADIYTREKKIMKKKVRREIYNLVGLSKSTIGAFVARPKKVNFDGQEPKEKIILFLRQHPIVNLKWIAIIVLMSTAPVFLTKIPMFDNFPARFIVASITIWYLLIAAFTIEQSLSWLFNVGIVTTSQVVDIDFFSLINKRITEADMDKIQDVTASTKGIVGSFFNYGSVYIQTAGEKPELEFINIPNPTLVANVIEKLRSETK